jgi:hypothetical protein
MSNKMDETGLDDEEGALSRRSYLAKVKDIREQITDNLSTPQYLQIYEELIENAMQPVLVSCNYFDLFLLRLVSWQDVNFRRKASFLKRAEFPRLAMTFLLQRTPEERLTAYRNLRLDRGARIEFLKLFLQYTAEYKKACNCELELPDGSSAMSVLSHCASVKADIEVRLKATHPLIAAIREVEYWLDSAQHFKQLLMEKYVRMCINTAEKDRTLIFGETVKLDDIVQTYLMAASRAIDKCDHRQGTLTTLIQKWMLTAREVITKQKDRTDNVTISGIDEEEVQWAVVQSYEQTVLDQNDEDEKLLVLCEVAKLVDPTGAAREILGIPEFLTERELKRLS